MYVTHFGFREKPFNVTPDPRFVYMNPAYREAYANLLAGIRERKGFIVLTGEVGTGKTTLLRMLMRNLEATVRFAYFYNTTLSFEELLTFACEELRLEAGGGRLKKIQALNDFLIDQLRRGGTGALLIDEAQHLSEHVLENLRLLSNLETGTEKLLQIVLVGQPELEAKLAQPSLRQLKQRVSALCRIDRLKDREIQPYIQFRLESVGYAGKEIFDRGSIQAIARYSSGIPRLINIICDNALTIAYATTRKVVSGDIIEEVATDLRLVEPLVAPAPAEAAPAAAAPAPAPAAVAPVAASPPRPEPVLPRSQPPFASSPPGVSRRARREARARRPLRPFGVAAAALAALAVAGGAAALAGPGLVQIGGVMASNVMAAGRAVVSTVAHALDGGSPRVAADPPRPAPEASPRLPAMEPRTVSAPVTAQAEAPGVATAVVAPLAPRPEPAPAAAEAAPVPPVPPVASPPAVGRPTPVSPPEPRRAAPVVEPPRSGRPAVAAVAPVAVGPVAAPAPPAPAPAKRSDARVASGPTRPEPERRPMVIPQGGTISDIAFRTYGHYSTLAVDLIKESNPHISDLDWIRAGDRLWLPPLTAETLVRPRPDGSYRVVLASFLSPLAAEKLSDAIRRRGFDVHVIPRQVTGQLSLYRVEIAGVGSRDAAESAWRTAVANCWVFIADAPCERTNP